MSNAAAGLGLIHLSADIVSAYVGYNAVSAHDLPDFIRLVYSAFSQANVPSHPIKDVREPAVPIKKSVFPGYIVCLEDGKKRKMLKRYLKSTYGLTPDQYRARWGLPVIYPMIAPNYAVQRSKLAKGKGLGRKAEPVEITLPLVVTKARKPRASKAKSAAAAAEDAAA